MTAHTIDLDLPFDDGITRVTAALGAEGFGVISRIDLDKAFREKLGIAFRRYAILGACNPGLAHKAVSSEPAIGLLLPCNVTVEETDAGVRVRLVDAQKMMSSAGIEENDELEALAGDANQRLDRVAESLRGSPAGG